MRMEMIPGINNCLIINDNYVADLSSLQKALDFLREQNNSTTHTLILSDFPQNESTDNTLYESIVKLVKQQKLNKQCPEYRFQQLPKDIWCF